MILSKQLKFCANNNKTTFVSCFTDGVQLRELRMLCIIRFGLYHHKYVGDGSILLENAGIHDWFDGDVNILTHSPIYYATARLSKCTVSVIWYNTKNISNHFPAVDWTIFLSHIRRLPAWGCRLLLRALGVTYEVRGIENIQRDHGGVVLMNHQSAIDLTGKHINCVRFACNMCLC